MIEFHFGYEYTMPEIFDMRYQERAESISSALFLYLNSSKVDSRLYPPALFGYIRKDRSGRSSEDMVPCLKDLRRNTQNAEPSLFLYHENIHQAGASPFVTFNIQNRKSFWPNINTLAFRKEDGLSLHKELPFQPVFGVDRNIRSFPWITMPVLENEVSEFSDTRTRADIIKEFRLDEEESLVSADKRQPVTHGDQFWGGNASSPITPGVHFWGKNGSNTELYIEKEERLEPKTVMANASPFELVKGGQNRKDVKPAHPSILLQRELLYFPIQSNNIHLGKAGSGLQTIEIEGLLRNHMQTNADRENESFFKAKSGLIDDVGAIGSWKRNTTETNVTDGTSFAPGDNELVYQDIFVLRQESDKQIQTENMIDTSKNQPDVSESNTTPLSDSHGRDLHWSNPVSTKNRPNTMGENSKIESILPDEKIINHQDWESILRARIQAEVFPENQALTSEERRVLEGVTVDVYNDRRRRTALNADIQVKTIGKNLTSEEGHYGIIDLSKDSSRKIHVNEELARYYKIIKDFKDTWEFSTQISYGLPDILLGRDHEESLAPKYKGYGLLKDTEEAIEKRETIGHGGELQLENQFFGYKPIQSPSPYPLIEAIRNVLRESNINDWLAVYDAGSDMLYMDQTSRLIKDEHDSQKVNKEVFMIPPVPEGFKPKAGYFAMRPEPEAVFYKIAKWSDQKRKPATYSNHTSSASTDKRDTGTRLSDKNYSKTPAPTYVEYGKAFGKLAEKDFHKTGIAKDICFAFRNNYPAAWYKTWKFLYNKTQEVNKIKNTLIFEMYWVSRLSNMDREKIQTQVWFYLAERPLFHEDGMLRFDVNQAAVSPKDMGDQEDSQFVMKNNIFDAKLSPWVMAGKNEIKEIQITASQWFDVRTYIEMYNREVPLIRAVAQGADIANQPVNIQEKRRQPFAPDDATFLFSKEFVQTMVPHYEAFLTDASARDILLDDRLVFDRIGDEDPIFKALSGGYDELLLPHQDFDYEALKAGLVDANGRILKPVTRIDDRTFIGKLPINHPLPHRKNFDKTFIEVDVQLMRFMIEIFYKVWQQNIFKFGGMDLRQAVEKMLDYMEIFVEYRIPGPLEQQAGRILRMFRWYGEAAIMRNAEYRIVMDYEPIKSDLHKGTMGIPGHLENLELKTTEYVLSMMNRALPATVVLELDAPVDTLLTFGCYFQTGEVKVLINDELLGTETKSNNKSTWPVPKGPCTVRIEYHHSEPFGLIAFGNLVVKDYVYRSLHTEYSPKVGTGNTALNEIVRRTTDYFFTLDANEAFVQQVTEGNLAIADLVKELTEYYSQHHANKHKGKRLTIKK